MFTPYKCTCAYDDMPPCPYCYSTGKNTKKRKCMMLDCKNILSDNDMLTGQTMCDDCYKEIKREVVGRIT